MLFFISLLDCCFQRSEFTNNLLCQNEWGGNNHKNINITLQFYWSSVIPTLPSAKTIKILRSLRNSSMRDTYIDRRLCISLVQMLKTVSILFINSKLVRTLWLVRLLSKLEWKQQYFSIIVSL